MLAHVLVWQRVAQLDVPFALVLEDDAEMRHPDRLLTPPAEFDYVFCTPSTAWSADQNSYARVPEILPMLLSHNAAPGAQAYLISPEGARQLQAVFQRDYYYSRVDLRMLGYACDLADIQAAGDGWPAQELTAMRRGIGDTPKLRGYALASPLAVHASPFSRRTREDVAGSTVPSPI